MVKAYVLIKCKTNYVESAVEEMRGVSDITETSIVTGYYDIIAEVEADEVNKLTQVIAGNIHGIEGVEDTTTCIAT